MPAPPATHLWIVGAGGFARQVVGVLEALAEAGERPAAVTFLGDDQTGPGAIGPYPVAPLAGIDAGGSFVIAIASPEHRRKLAERAEARGAIAVMLQASTARVSAHAEVAPGAVICDFAVIEPFASIGRHFHANVRAFVAHDCVIGDYVTFGPNAHCNGNVHIGDRAYVGAGAVIRQGTPDKPLRIGAGAVIGMGAVVTKDVPAGAVVVGNPARPLERG